MTVAASSIEWCDSTWSPVRGCSRVSPGCDNCYAMRQARRFDFPGGAYEGLTRIGKRGVDWNGVVRLVPEALDQPLRWRAGRRVFVNPMSDLFHESIPAASVRRVLEVMVAAPHHTYQVLTKRPRRMDALVREWLEDRNRGGRVPRHIWLGVSVEDQATADERILPLLHTPAAVRFVSYEPALGPVDFGGYYFDMKYGRDLFPMLGPEHRTKLIDLLDWVIVGGESGPGARPFSLRWARSVVEQCRQAGVAAFVKQLGARPCNPSCSSPECTHPDCDPGWLQLHDPKGGNPSEWPRDLRVREFPR